RRWNGTTMLAPSNPSPGNTMRGVGGTGPGDVWIAGDTLPETYHYDGTQFRVVFTDAGESIGGIYAPSATEQYFISGYHFYRHTTGPWENALLINTTGFTFLTDIAGAPGTPIWGVAGPEVWRLEGDS